MISNVERTVDVERIASECRQMILRDVNEEVIRDRLDRGKTILRALNTALSNELQLIESLLERETPPEGGAALEGMHEVEDDNCP